MLIIKLITYTTSLLLWGGYEAANAKPTKSALQSTFATSADYAYWEHVNKTCLSRDCDEHVNLKHLQHLSTHMNRAINPCDNFHEYACSYWKQQHPQEKTSMTLGEQQLTENFQKIFELREKDLREDLIMQKLYKYYEVCRNSERKEKANWGEYIKSLRELDYIQFNNDTNWLQTLRDLNVFSTSQYFISIYVDRQNSTLFMLHIDPHNAQAKVKFSLEIYELLRFYTTDSYEDLALKFNNLELQLENILNNNSCQNSIQDENDECDLSEIITYAELLKRNSSSTMWEFLLSLYPLNPQDQLEINDIESIEKIKYFLDHENQQLLFLYSLSRFINNLQLVKHNLVERGSTPASCLRHMRKHFPIHMNYLYDKIYYAAKRSESDAVINYVFSKLKEKFSLILDLNHMKLSLESVQYLKMKLNYLQLNIGNLPKNVSEEFYRDFISDVNVTEDFYTNHLMALKHFHYRKRLLTSRGNVANYWFSFNYHKPDFLDSFDSTPYYYSRANFIILPYAYLQLPFYDHRFWPSLLYGDLANTLGHELMHAFDINFLMYDYGGNINDAASLLITNNSEFQQNLNCLNKTPTKFLTERIADISGTRLALRTFIRDPLFLKHNGKLFFLQFAQFMCGASELATFDDTFHDLDSLRLNYTLAHTPEFAEVFQCPLGSPMNPIEKCQLW